MSDLIYSTHKTWEYFLDALSKEIFEERGIIAFAPGIEDPNLNFVMQTQEIEDDLEEIFHKVSRFYKTQALTWFWMLNPSRDQTAVKNMLHTQGYKVTESHSTFVGFVNQLSTSDILTKFTIREVNEENLDHWAIPLQEAFQGTYESVQLYLEAHRRALHKNINLRHYVTYVDKEPVCAGTLSFSPHGGRLDDLGTKFAYQRQGFGRVMAIYCMQVAKELGYDWVCLDASDQGALLYKKMGFKELCSNAIYGKPLGI